MKKKQSDSYFFHGFDSKEINSKILKIDDYTIKATDHKIVQLNLDKKIVFNILIKTVIIGTPQKPTEILKMHEKRAVTMVLMKRLKLSLASPK